MSIVNSALILVALSSPDQLENDFLERVHILKLVVNDAVFDEFVDLLRLFVALLCLFVAHLRLSLHDFVVHVALCLQLFFLASELLIHNFEHLLVESPLDF